jgi:hypothetical protein
VVDERESGQQRRSGVEAEHADELAIYCLHALSAASSLHSPPAVHRLVQTTLTGLGNNPQQQHESRPLQDDRQ